MTRSPSHQIPDGINSCLLGSYSYSYYRMFVALAFATAFVVLPAPAVPGRTAGRTAGAWCLEPAQGDLPSMYKERWKDDDGAGGSSVKMPAGSEEFADKGEEACVTKEDAEVCGEVSFDSTEDGMV